MSNVGTNGFKRDVGTRQFASEREMSELEDTKISIFNKFVTIEFDKEDANRSKMQGIANYLKDVKIMQRI